MQLAHVVLPSVTVLYMSYRYGWSELQVGLALATSIGAWINLGLVIWFAHRANHTRIDERLRHSAIKLAVAGLIMAGMLWLCAAPVAHFFSDWDRMRDLAALIALSAIGGGIYGGIVLGLFGREWLDKFRAAKRR